MSRDVDAGSGHPVARFLDVLEAGLADLVEAPLWSMNAEETAAVVDRLVAGLSRLGELEARVLNHAGSLDVHGAAGMKTLQRWLAHRTRLTSGEAARRVRLAEALASHELTREAMGRGEVHAEQAKVIAKAVEGLDGAHVRHRGVAEKHLIGEAAHFDAGELATLGLRILEVIDPERADEHEAKALEKQEAKARKDTSFSMWHDGEGKAHGKFVIPAAQGEMLRKALQGSGGAEARARYRGGWCLRPREADRAQARVGVQRVRRALPDRSASRDGRARRDDRGHRRRGGVHPRCSEGRHD